MKKRCGTTRWRSSFARVKQATFLLELGRGAGSEVRGHAAVDDVQDVDRLPFLALGRVDGRQDQIVLVKKRDAGLIAGCVRWVQSEFGQEALARRISASDLLELNELGASNLGIFVDAVEMRFVPKAGTLEV